MYVIPSLLFKINLRVNQRNYRCRLISKEDVGMVEEMAG